MFVWLTGAAGFIGFHTAQALLAQGVRVIGVDNLNTYYDPALKRARLHQLREHANFTFLEADISDRDAMLGLAKQHGAITHIVHLAAQAGVRYSMIDPYAYVQSNVMGHLVMLEAARLLPDLRHFVYASSSSVYGGNTELPFREADRVDLPVSLYAATKRADELISQSYAHLYSLPQTGLRFFTVYGPWGRPDMAYYSFAQAIAAGRPITVYDGGSPRRDFTYVDDIVAGITGVLTRPPADAHTARVLNIGNHRSEAVSTLISLLESGLGRKAVIEYVPRPAADVAETFADVSGIRALCGFSPDTALADGVARFVEWFKKFHNI